MGAHIFERGMGGSETPFILLIEWTLHPALAVVQGKPPGKNVGSSAAGPAKLYGGA